MEKIVNCVLLIDDNFDDNFFHKKALERNGKVNIIRVAENGIEGLEYLNNQGKFEDKEANPRPNIIFLDINMPKMNGFEFLEKYRNLNVTQKAEICITMLSTSKNPDDIEKAKSFGVIEEFFTKPLENEAIEVAIKRYTDKIGQ
ncbi:response regulator [Ekhidna sp.]